MTNTTTIMPNTVLFDKQIPVTDVDSFYFKTAINGRLIKCFINGARVNNPFTKNVNVDVSFKIIEDLEVVSPGTSITGKTLSTAPIWNLPPGKEDKKANVKGKNVTLNFDVLKNEEKGVIQIINEHELYNVVATVLKSKNMMDKEEKGSIRTHHTKLNSLLKNGEVYLTSVPVEDMGKSYLEVNAVGER